MELFPKFTELVVGPGFQGSPILLPGFPHLADSPLDARAIDGRNLVEVDFKDSDLNIGGFRAHDFFGDGSFYLLGKRGVFLRSRCSTVVLTEVPTWP